MIQVRNILLAFFWTSLVQLSVSAQTGELPRCSPEAVGLPSEAVISYFDSLMSIPNTEIHSCLLMRHGKVIAEIHPQPFKADYGHTLFSCSKTFTAVAVGLAIEDKLLRLEDRLVSFFPEYLPYPVSPRLSRITIEDLLTMRSGFVVDTKMRTISDHWVRDYLSHSMNAEPGTLFAYDSIDTYLLSAIIQKVTGLTLLEYLKRRIFTPLHIKRVKWEFSPEGITTGGWGLYLQAESMAKFGQLLLQRGNWKGRQLIPSKWVDEMMRKHATNPNGDDYCFQMWRCGAHNAAMADGAYGQHIFVMPDEDMVIVTTQCMVGDRSHQKDMIWGMLVPWLQNAPLEEGHALKQLRKRESQYAHPLPKGHKNVKFFAQYLGKFIQLKANPLDWKQLQFLKTENEVLVILITDKDNRTGRVKLGYKEWSTSDVNLYPLYVRTATRNRFSSFYPPFKAGSAYAWEEDKLHVKIHFVDWLTSIDLLFVFEGEHVNIRAQENYLDKPITLQGTLLK